MSSGTGTQDRHLRLSLSKAFREHRVLLAGKLFDAIRESEGVSEDSPTSFSELDDWNQQVLYTVTDLGVEWFAKFDDSSLMLFQGWIQSEMLLPALTVDSPDRIVPAAILSRAKAYWIAGLGAHLGKPELDLLDRAIEGIVGNLSRPMRRKLQVLLIGDCLKWEIMTSLLGPAGQAQISITRAELGERVLPVLRNQIRALDPKEFDLVFFSPFSHQFFQKYIPLLKLEAAPWSRDKLHAMIDELMEDVNVTLRLLAQHFTCPVYVHNTAGAVQIFDIPSGILKELAAKRNRATVTATIDRKLRKLLEEQPLAGQVRLIDERALADKLSFRELGKVFFKGLIFHPARIGVELGQGPYFEAVYSAAYLSTKKVVVCDLDNTVWDGVIGEGAVTHFHDRQKILKGLRERGVLLSINSKNDPAKVHFTGGTLQMDDFVAPQINWLPKTGNMAAIVKELNMKAKDFIFIDDLPDQLERMRNAYPEMVVMDATDPMTWKLFSHWQKHLSSEMEEDRTKLYQERLARDQYLAGQPAPESAQEDEAAAFRDLEISVKVETVSKPGLKRVVELINRTNQFNLCGSRTTLRDEETGLGEDHYVLTATAKDKFGGMGVVGVMRVDKKPDHVEVPIFVLSCRVFGFGIEYALLNAVRELAPPDQPIVGRYKETQANQPGRQLYAKAGLTWDGENWVGKVADLGAPPEWLTVEMAVGK